MKKVIIVSLMVVAVLAFVVGPVMATKPGTEPSVPGGLPQNPNGFPSGDHDNLLLHGKKDNFTCPEKSFYLEIETCPLNVCGDYPVGTQVEECPPGGYTCELTDPLVPIYGNVVFIPRDEEQWCDCSPPRQSCDAITILFESGSKGPKAPKKDPGGLNANELQVIDWCTEHFPDNAPDGAGDLECDSAIVRLPADKEGYAVYARILGKPGEEPEQPTLSISPSLVYVMDTDDEDQDLLLLGLVTPDGVFKWDDGWVLVRTDSDAKGKGGKGVQKAKDITGLFLWTGDVCYLDPYEYCLDEFGDPILDDENDSICYEKSWCCVDIYEYEDGTPQTGDGIYDQCQPPDCDQVDPSDCWCPDDGCDLSEPQPKASDLCYDWTDEVQVLWCRHYEEEWVFNIADFVGYLWDIDHTGVYNVQVRFYPLSQVGEGE